MPHKRSKEAMLRRWCKSREAYPPSSCVYSFMMFYIGDDHSVEVPDILIQYSADWCHIRWSDWPTQVPDAVGDGLGGAYDLLVASNSLLPDLTIQDHGESLVEGPSSPAAIVTRVDASCYLFDESRKSQIEDLDVGPTITAVNARGVDGAHSLVDDELRVQMDVDHTQLEETVAVDLRYLQSLKVDLSNAKGLLVRAAALDDARDEEAMVSHIETSLQIQYDTAKDVIRSKMDKLAVLRDWSGKGIDSPKFDALIADLRGVSCAPISVMSTPSRMPLCSGERSRSHLLRQSPGFGSEPRRTPQLRKKG